MRSMKSPSTSSSSRQPSSSETAFPQYQTWHASERTRMMVSLTSVTSRSAHRLRFVNSNTGISFTGLCVCCWAAGAAASDVDADGGGIDPDEEDMGGTAWAAAGRWWGQEARTWPAGEQTVLLAFCTGAQDENIDLSDPAPPPLS